MAQLRHCSSQLAQLPLSRPARSRSRSRTRARAAAQDGEPQAAHEVPSAPLEVCWDIFGQRRTAWTAADEGLCWDRFGFRVEERVMVVMDAYWDHMEENVWMDAKIACVDYHLHSGPSCYRGAELGGGGGGQVAV